MSFGRRVLGALGLEARAFEDVERDAGALGQAGLLVLLAGLARGTGVLEREGLIGLLGSPVVAVVVWLVASLLIWGIGVRRFAYSSDYPELVRTLGFAAAPLLLLALSALPLGAFEPVLWVGAHAWASAALLVAVREALDVPMSRALVVCALALGVTLALFFAAGLLFTDFGPLG